MSEEKCPECGESYLEVRRYSDKSTLYIHEQGFKTKPFRHVLVVKSCYVNQYSLFAFPDG